MNQNTYVISADSSIVEVVEVAETVEIVDASL